MLRTSLPKFRAPGFLLALLFAAHFFVTLRLISPRTLFSGEPIAVADYALDFSRSVAVSELFSQYHRGWGYNPFFLAGYPAGTVFDVNNHFIELFVYGVHRLGIALPTAFNLFVFVAILLVPLAVFLAARNFHLSPGQQVVATALGLLLWYGDSNVSLTWRVGVIASGAALYALPLSLSCLYRYREDRTRLWYLGFLVSGALVSLLHPLSFLFFYIPVALFLVWRAQRYDLRFWGAMALFAAVVLTVNSFWILPFLQFAALKTRSGYHWIGNAKALARDLVGTTDSGLRLLVVLLAGGGLWVWWREDRKELVEIFLFVAVALTGAGYFAGEFSFFRDLETYRNNLVLSFLLVLPAAVFLTAALPLLKSLARPRRWAAAAVILLLGAHLVGRNLWEALSVLRPGTETLGLQPLGKAEKSVIAWLRDHADGGERAMTEYWPLGALLPWYTGMQVIGGPYPIVWMPHNFANFSAMGDASAGEEIRLFGRDIRQFSPEECRSYLDTFNVGWVVAYTNESRSLFDRSAELEPVADIGRYRIYRNTDPSDFFLAGKGEVRADYGSLRVSDATPGEIILKYHWSFSLVTDPPQPLLAQRVLDDPVPFIKVPDNRFGEFVIRDSSRWP